MKIIKQIGSQVPLLEEVFYRLLNNNLNLQVLECLGTRTNLPFLVGVIPNRPAAHFRFG